MSGFQVKGNISVSAPTEGGAMPRLDRQLIRSTLPTSVILNAGQAFRQRVPRFPARSARRGGGDVEPRSRHSSDRAPGDRLHSRLMAFASRAHLSFRGSLCTGRRRGP
jgi:hypothetical protein